MTNQERAFSTGLSIQIQSDVFATERPLSPFNYYNADLVPSPAKIRPHVIDKKQPIRSTQSNCRALEYEAGDIYQNLI